jgi:hypothetical protein
MSGQSKEQQARLVQKAEQAFAKEKHQRKVLDEGRGDHASVMAKTAKLRVERLAKEAAERGGASKAEPSKRGRK